MKNCRKAVKSCDSITYSVPGVGQSVLRVGEVSFTAVGDDSFAGRFTASKGALEGFELMQVAASSDDVVLGLTFVSTDPADAEAATKDAVNKVQDALGSDEHYLNRIAVLVSTDLERRCSVWCLLSWPYDI